MSDDRSFANSAKLSHAYHAFETLGVVPHTVGLAPYGGKTIDREVMAEVDGDRELRAA